jgi:hypothetical protein
MAWRRYPWLPEDPPPPEPEDGWLPGEVLHWVEDEPPPSKRAVVDDEQILDALIRFKQTQPDGPVRGEAGPKSNSFVRGGPASRTRLSGPDAPGICRRFSQCSVLEK